MSPGLQASVRTDSLPTVTLREVDPPQGLSRGVTRSDLSLKRIALATVWRTDGSCKGESREAG